MQSTLQAAVLSVGLAGLMLSAAGMWLTILSSPINYYYHIADSTSCFHDLRTCERKQSWKASR